MILRKTHKEFTLISCILATREFNTERCSSVWKGYVAHIKCLLLVSSDGGVCKKCFQSWLPSLLPQDPLSSPCPNFILGASDQQEVTDRDANIETIAGACFSEIGV